MGEDVYDIDSVLKELGQFGRYQQFNYILICIPVMFNAIFTLSYVFTAGSLEYRCRVNECDYENSTYSVWWLNNSIPSENGFLSKCKRFDLNSTTIEYFEHQICTEDAFDRTKIKECNEFIYKDEESTIQNEWNITCDDEWKLTLVGSINNIGQFIGMPLGGFISDRYGRRTALALSGTLSALMGIARSFSINYIMFVTFELLDSIVGSVIYAAAIILGMELVGPNKRILGCTILGIFYPLGEVLLGLVAKYTQNWRLLLQCLYVPALIHSIYFWIVPESIRWLLTEGKTENAINILRKVAKFNKATLSEDSINQISASQEKISKIKTNSTEKINNYPIFSAFKSSTLIWRIINCSFCWLTNTLVYYGLSLNSVSLDGDKYLNFIFVCLVEVPGLLLTYFIADRFGRRLTMFSTLVISGIACLASIVVSIENQWLGLSLFLIGKLAITMSFSALYVYTTEMFPTNLRHSLLSFCSMFGRIGSIIAPQTPLIANYMASLPLILFGGCAITSGLLSLKFPETLNTKLPDTIFEAEIVGQKIKTANTK